VYSGGVWGGRLYCSGALFTVSSNNGEFFAASGIGLWHSDDGGQNWSYPSGVAWSSGGGLLDDKPTMAVSYYQGTLGDVYVSWIVASLNTPTSSSLWVSRSTDGGATFESPVVVSYDDVQAPALAVDSNTGTIYVVWVNLRYGDIRMAQSSGDRGSALSFGAHSVVSSGIIQYPATLNGLRKANTIPAARYNFIANRLMVIWHAIGDDLSADVFYSYYPCSGADCNYWGFRNRIVASASTVNDQFMPAMDYNRYGDVLVSFYDRRGDGARNLLYTEYASEFHSDGSGLADMQISSFSSNPQDSSPNTVDARFIGDYQDAWVWAYPDGDRLVSAWTGVPSGNIGEIIVSRSNP
jgi:hypothetical protein